MLYCLQIERARPGKRPYASMSVYHFKTIEEADEKRRNEKREYYEGFLQHLEEEGEDVPKDIDLLDEDEAQSYIYYDSYMDMLPFSATLYVIEIEDDSISSKRIPFPVSAKLEV